MKGIKQAKTDEEFTGFCVIRKKELRRTKSEVPYLLLELGDSSGRLRGKLWKDSEKFFKTLHEGQIIKLKGTIRCYLDTRELQIEKLRPALKEDNISHQQLLPRSRKNIPKLKSEFLIHIRQIKNRHLKELIFRLFPDDDSLEQYLRMPSGKLWHHNYMYGVLEHTLCLLDLAETVSYHYSCLDKDLLKAGIILGEIGKMHIFKFDGFIDYSTEGRLLGHTVRSYEQVKAMVDTMDDFPPDIRLRLLHILLSQTTDLESDESMQIPMTLESIILNMLKRLDYQSNACQRIIENDEQPASGWTKYNNLFDRFIYIGHKPHQDNQEKQDYQV